MNPYQVLNVPENATDEEIRAAFKHLVLDRHPDKSADPRTAAPYQYSVDDITAAKNMLRDPISRMAVDKRLAKERRTKGRSTTRKTQRDDGDPIAASILALLNSLPHSRIAAVMEVADLPAYVSTGYRIEKKYHNGSPEEYKIYMLSASAIGAADALATLLDASCKLTKRQKQPHIILPIAFKALSPPYSAAVLAWEPGQYQLTRDISLFLSASKAYAMFARCAKILQSELLPLGVVPVGPLLQKFYVYSQQNHRSSLGEQQRDDDSPLYFAVLDGPLRVAKQTGEAARLYAQLSKEFFDFRSTLGVQPGDPGQLYFATKVTR